MTCCCALCCASRRPRRPVWLMRQAGRYLPEYRATRARAGGFLAMCTNPAIACEVTLQPVESISAGCGHFVLRYPHDPARHEFRLAVRDRRRPEIRASGTLRRRHRQARRPDPGRELKYVIDAVALIRRELGGRIPLIGFAGSPWTVATYMVEGGGSKTFGLIKRMMYESPRDLHRLLRVARPSNHSVPQRTNSRRSTGGDAVRYLGRSADAGAVRRILPALHGRDRRRLDARGGRPPRTEYRIHQGRRRDARQNCGYRLRRRRRGLDHRPRHGAARRRRPGRAARQLWIPRRCLHPPKRCVPKHCGCWKVSAQGPGMCSTWVTASRPMSIPSGWPCSSIRCAITPLS